MACEPLNGTKPLAADPDPSARMRQGIDRFATRLTAESIGRRARHWQRDTSSPEAHWRSVEPNRSRFRRMIGADEPRLPITELEYVAGTAQDKLVARCDGYRVIAVRWAVFPGVYGEGLLVEPESQPRARIVVISDADQTPEMLLGLAPGLDPDGQIARRLAEQGCQLVLPTLVNRDDTWSGNPRIAMTNQPHREWIYRQAFDFGAHIIGYEVQKILSVVDWFHGQPGGVPIALAGYAEGGLLALYAAAIDARIDAALVSGYFDSRQRLYEEPIYRNLFGLLDEFGDAEIASLAAAAIVVEHSHAPRIDGPPAARDGRRDCAAPGRLATPRDASVAAEVERAAALLAPIGQPRGRPPIRLIAGQDGGPTGPCSTEAIASLLEVMGLRLLEAAPEVLEACRLFDADQDDARQRRAIQQLVDHTQAMLARADDRQDEFWRQADTASLESWQASCLAYKNHLWDEVIGRLGPADAPLNPRTRKINETPDWTAYEVTLDVWPEVFCWGTLLVPRDLADGQRRPVVVCQHGLEGIPADVITEDPADPAFASYQGFAARLARRGFIVYAPHNCYRGGNEFRQLQRKLSPLKKSLFSVILAQHQRHLEWLAGLPFVDAGRIGFYGLSYGGFTAVRVPPLLDGYALSISSAEFNDMVKKKASIYDAYSYPFHNTYEVGEFNLANTFGYADLAGLMAPRPFMVERGHQDGVAPDEWVASEYAKVRRLYARLGIPGRTEIEFFDGPHTIHGVGTFEFLHRHLDWPKR